MPKKARKKDQLLSDRQAKAIIYNAVILASDLPQGNITKPQLEKIVAWAEDAVMNKMLLEMVLEGTMFVGLDPADGEIVLLNAEDVPQAEKFREFLLEETQGNGTP